MKVIVYLISVVASVFLACAATPQPQQTDGQKREAADGAYFIARAACRDKIKYPTVEQSDACAAAERLRWHRLPDGGPDGTFADGGAK